MDEWFTVERLDDKSFVISEYHHWEEPHSYLLLGEARALMIDTGLGVGNILKVVRQLTDLPVTVATTHAHWDHIGGHRQFKDIGVHEKEAQWLSGNFPLSLTKVKQSLTCQICPFPSDFCLENYQIYKNGVQHRFLDGDIIDLGGRNLQVIHTPGHSPGHCCFFELERRWLYTGDLVYAGCLDAFYPTTDPRQFFQSLCRVDLIKPLRILPGHHQLYIENALLHRIVDGFAWLENSGKLSHGNGIFSFQGFQIHV